MSAAALPPRQRLEFEGATVELALFGLDELPDATRLTCLAPDELRRAERFHFGRDRRRYLAARCGLRERLAAATGRAAGELQFVEGPFGKPRLDGLPHCHFNLAHSDDLAVLAVTQDGEIGVDIESLEPMDDALALARANYTASEREWLLALPPGERDAGFLRLWTRKEACLKAIGTGLSVHPSSFSVGLGDDTQDVTMVWPAGRARLLLREVEAGPQAVAALALRV